MSTTPVSETEPLAQGIESMLAPIVLGVDKAIMSAQQSQEDLGKEIERLVADLELFNAVADPPRLQPALEKLADARKRLAMTNKLMQQTQTRVQRIQSRLQNMPSAPAAVRDNVLTQ
ncbi:hypothetical protein BX666DRAFT_1932401 [Dichotomocladium elegans]|nr:hypothetical protein BX666DRAFT_1932401 [Dichotomocladium elegans]